MNSPKSTCRKTRCEGLCPTSSAEPTRQKHILVIKVGTSTLMSENSVTSRSTFCLTNLGRLVDTICDLKAMGHDVVLVTSGAVGAGCAALHLTSRPTSFVGKQAMAAIGQCKLTRLYEDLFGVREQKVAQMLMTRNDFVSIKKYTNFSKTIMELLHFDVVPIINENDSVVGEGLKFGDNDTFAAHLAVSISAFCLIILTDVDCLYTTNPRTNPDAKPIQLVEGHSDLVNVISGNLAEGTQWGIGGMQTKIIASQIVTILGIHMFLCHGSHTSRILDMLQFAENYVDGTTVFRESALKSISPSLKQEMIRIVDGNEANEHVETIPSNAIKELPFLGTIFTAWNSNICTQTLRKERRWLLSLPLRGCIFIDKGAVSAILLNKKSLLLAGVVKVTGTFQAGEAASICYSEDVCQGTVKCATKKAGGMKSSHSLPVLMTDGVERHSEGCAKSTISPEEIARGLVSLRSDEVDRFKGMTSAVLADTMGFDASAIVCDRHYIIYTCNDSYIKNVLHYPSKFQMKAT